MNNFLRHILEECDFMMDLVAKGLDREKLLQDQTIQRAVTRSFEIIGEASKKITPEFKEKHPDIEWKKMAGMRDRLIHHYMGVNYFIVWDAIKNEIPKLQQQIKSILQI